MPFSLMETTFPRGKTLFPRLGTPFPHARTSFPRMGIMFPPDAMTFRPAEIIFPCQKTFFPRAETPSSRSAMTRPRPATPIPYPSIPHSLQEDSPSTLARLRRAFSASGEPSLSKILSDSRNSRAAATLSPSSSASLPNWPRVRATPFWLPSLFSISRLSSKRRRASSS